MYNCIENERGFSNKSFNVLFIFITWMNFPFIINWMTKWYRWINNSLPEGFSKKNAIICDVILWNSAHHRIGSTLCKELKLVAFEKREIRTIRDEEKPPFARARLLTKSEYSHEVDSNDLLVRNLVLSRGINVRGAFYALSPLRVSYEIFVKTAHWIARRFGDGWMRGGCGLINLRALNVKRRDLFTKGYM